MLATSSPGKTKVAKLNRAYVLDIKACLSQARARKKQGPSSSISTINTASSAYATTTTAANI